MTRISGLRRFVRLPRGTSAAIDDELRFHVECRVDELVAGGMSETDARIAAARELGDWNRYRADCLTIDSQFAREVHMRELIESVWADFRHAARALRGQPGFATVAVLTLALGIGATTSVFSAVSGVLLRPLPYVGAGRIMHVGEQQVTKPGRGGTTSFDNFNDWQRTSRSFAAMGIVASFSPTMTGRGDPERVSVALVTAGMFDVFHVKPYLGRAIVPDDNLAGSDAVAILSYDYWKTRFGGDPSVVGQTLTLNFTPVQVVGVLPPGFTGPGRLANPMWGNFVNDTSDGRGGRSKDVYALLRTGVTPARAQAEMTQLAAQLAATYPKDDKGETVIVDPLADRTVGDLRRPLYLLLGAAFLVLLIACANLSNLLLARGLARGREMAVRAALGAGRGRLTRQLLTESVLIAVLGSAAGIAIAAGAIKLLGTLGPAVFQTRPPAMSAGVLVVAVGLSVATTLLFGLVPALRLSPRDPQLALRDAGARVTGGSRKTRTVLAVTQLALAVVLLSASTLVIKSFVRVLEVQPGIRADHLLTIGVTLSRARYDSTKSTTFYQQLAARLKGMPGVESVAFTSLVPFGGDFDRVNITKIGGEAERAGADAATADRYVVSPSYFATMGVRLVRGRLPNDDDRLDAPFICVVDEVFARRTFTDREAIGQTLFIPGRRAFATIVGVVTHVKTYGLDVDSPGQIYLSNEQVPWRWSSIVVRTVGSPLAFAPTVARVVHGIDADQPVADIASMDDLMADLLRSRRFTLALFVAFAAVAVTLASIGLYGVVAHGVTQRRREFGVRMALGAQRPLIARMILLEGVRIAAIGVVIGGAGALAMGRFIAALLFEVSARDGTAFAIVALGLVGVAMLACVVPAHRATTVDAAEVLRGD